MLAIGSKVKDFLDLYSESMKDKTNSSSALNLALNPREPNSFSNVLYNASDMFSSGRLGPSIAVTCVFCMNTGSWAYPRLTSRNPDSTMGVAKMTRDTIAKQIRNAIYLNNLHILFSGKVA